MKRYAFLFIITSLVFCEARIANAGTLVDNGDGTISDQGTYLMWQKQDDGTTRTWDAAITYCEGLTIAGHTDWRLPTIKELKSIADMTKFNLSINTTYFPGTQLFAYWSSTTNTEAAPEAWLVSFSEGTTGTDYKSDPTHMVRCVR